MNDSTIYQVFSKSSKIHADRTALMYKEDGDYRSITYRELAQRVNAVAAGLHRAGFRKSDRVAIMSYNRPEWVICDLATMKLGGVVVPLYNTPGHVLPVSLIKYIINDSGARILFLENVEVYNLIRESITNMPSVEIIVLFDADSGENAGYLRYSDLEQEGEGCKDEMVAHDEMATIVYTSGTTGDPKGVVLTHHNIVSNASAAIKHCGFTGDDVVLSYLPLAHMFERTCDYYCVLFAGGAIGYAEDLTTAAQDAEKVRPTVVLAVPRVIEKVYAVTLTKVEESPPIRRGLVNLAVKSLNELANRRYRGSRIPLLLRIKCSVLDKLVASKFRKLCGGRIRLIVSGAAPLNRRIAKAFYIMGFNILEGYGLTEASPVVACNALEDNCLGTVGRPLPGVEVRIGDNDEILIRGPNVMKEYYNKSADTVRAIDKEGWLHSGDQGAFDEKGHLKITGRIKEIIVTSTGKNVAPAPIEAKISTSVFVDQVMLYGDQRSYLVALVVPSQQIVEEYARSRKIAYNDYAELLSCGEMKNAIKHDIFAAIGELPGYAQIKAFALVPEQFSVANEMLTPTLKLRRGHIVRRYYKVLESMYGDGGEGDVERRIVHL
ncbi:MAG: long-chain fatty acid--CoA ligase [candidate division WOR-3 bacterium]|nr:MAG: long-chain fatty acid--CoA ligase [candidate division WOR-3 bacterium]